MQVTNELLKYMLIDLVVKKINATKEVVTDCFLNYVLAVG